MGMISSAPYEFDCEEPGRKPGLFAFASYSREMAQRRERLGLFHQFGDYFVAALLLLSLARTEVPAWPLVVGVVGLANAAMTRGPLAAFRRVSLGLHAVADIGVVVACLVGAVAVRSNTTDAFVLGSAALIQAVVVWLARSVDRASQ